LLIIVVLLILVIIPGIGTVRNGSRSWFGIGSFGIQPSEAAKLILIIFTSKYLSKNQRNMKNIKKGVIPILSITLLIFGLIMLQPDFGTGVIIVMSIIGLLFISGVDIKFFLGLGVLGVIGIVVLILIAPYRLERILSFLNPWSDSLGSGFQIIQSLYAIGPGGLFGYGFLNSRQKHFYLPEPQTDFIFSIISEEFGFMGVVIVSTLFLIIIIHGFRISRKSNDLFSKYLAFGITFELAFQALLNLMVVVGLIPVTGVTLPFLSYGGSSLMITLCGMGILLNISRYQK
jgi:cell division protein FtsW